jgi:dTMP kinase
LSVFVVLEGGDASGKSTQAARLSARLAAAGHEVVETFEPGATSTGRTLREVLLHGSEPLDATAEMLLMAADRAQHVREIIRPALSRGAWVVCDRHVPSSLVYQGVARALGVEVVERVNEVATAGTLPALVIVIDVDDATAAARRPAAGDPFESENGALQATVRAAYPDLAPSRGWVVVDGRGEVAEVAERVWEVVTERLVV